MTIVLLLVGMQTVERRAMLLSSVRRLATGLLLGRMRLLLLPARRRVLLKLGTGASRICCREKNYWCNRRVVPLRLSVLAGRWLANVLLLLMRSILLLLLLWR